GPRLADAAQGRQVLVAADVVAHHVADQAAHVPAGERIVTDVADAVLAEAVADHLKDAGLHLLRHPRVNAVAEDVIERAVPLVDVEDAGAAQLDVFQAERRDGPAALLDLLVRVIDADEM